MDIKPYGKNAKKHPDKQVELIANSIRHFGWQQPIVVDKEGTIIVGHGRYLAYQNHEGLDEPWITDNEGNTIQGKQGRELTDKEIKAYRLADNKINESDWDMDLVIEELKELDELVPLTGFDPLILNGEFNFKNKEIDPEAIEQQAGEVKTRPCPNCGYEF